MFWHMPSGLGVRSLTGAAGYSVATVFNVGAPYPVLLRDMVAFSTCGSLYLVELFSFSRWFGRHWRISIYWISSYMLCNREAPWANL